MSLTILVMVFRYHHQWYVHIAQCANSVAMPQSETPNLDLPPTQFWATDDHTTTDRDDGIVAKGVKISTDQFPPQKN